MKKMLLLIAIGIWISISANLIFAQTLTDTIFNRYDDNSFAYGADVSWLPQLESWGTVFKDDNGKQKDLLLILKEHGVNALRFRVWHPVNGSSGKNEVVKLSKRAHDMGFKVMIDFHYSDSWADPGKQFKPAAWEGHTLEQLIQDVYDHTYDVLNALKNVGVTPEWVQVGNETKRGMLWPEGNTKDTPNGMSNFARMVNSGYKAIKDIDTTILAIVHLPDADENSLYRSMFDGLKKNGAKWDIIGMSAYPHWAHLGWKEEINASVANMKDMIARYDTKVMVVEAGHQWDKPFESNNYLVELMDTMMSFGGLGCFFWEPEATMVGTYELTAWNPDTRRPTIAMDAYLGIKHIDPKTVIHISLDEPVGGSIYNQNDNITILASASHEKGEIAKVSFYVNDKLVGQKTEAPYSYELSNTNPGRYNIYTTATDTNNIIVQSETVTVQVGVMEIIQEDGNGYCGITNNEGTIDSNNANFTGSGFINTDNKLGVTINWTVNFIEAGSYQLEYRYAATSTRPGEITINGVSIGTLPFESTGSWTMWKYASITCTINEAGEVPISVTATGAEGLPNIDYMSIKPIGNAIKPEGALNCLDQYKEPNSISLSGDNNSLTVFQNAEKNLVVINSSQKLDEVRIYSLNGTIVKSFSEVDNTHITIPCAEMISGIYLLKTVCNNATKTRQFNIIQ